MTKPYQTLCLLIAVTMSACTNQLPIKNSACETAIHNYASAIDLGDPAEAAESFTATGTWQLGEIRLVGKQAIANHFSQLANLENRKSRHIQTNLVINWQNKSLATGIVYLTLYRVHDRTGPVATMNEQPYFVGHYQDQYVWDGEYCRISERIIVPAFLNQS